MPEPAKAEDRISTPMKNAMIGFPKPVRTTFANVSMPITGMRSMARSAVMLNGMTSVIHSTIAATRSASTAFPDQESGMRSPPRSIGAGDGRARITPISTSASPKSANLEQRRVPCML